MKNSIEPVIVSHPLNAPGPQIGQMDKIDDTIDVRGLFRKFWAGKWIVASCLIIAYVLGHLSTSQIVPTYRATATVMFDIEQSNIIESILNEEGFDRGRLEDEILILSSTNLIERVVDQLALDEDPEFNPALRVVEPSLLDRARDRITLPPEILDIMKDLGLIGAPPTPTINPDARQRAQEGRMRVLIVRNVLRRLQLEPIGNSNVLAISFFSTSRNTAASVANAVADQYIVDQLEAKLDATEAATDWLSARVDELRVRLEEAENKLEAARADLAVEQGQSLDITQQRLVALNATLVQVQGEATRLLSDFNRMENALENPDDLEQVSEFRASLVISEMRQRETDLAEEVLRLRASVADDNPTLQGAERLLDDLRAQTRSQIIAEAQKIVAATENDLIAAQEREAALIDQVRELEQKAFSQAADEVTLRQLEREALASQALYENFLSRLQEANVQEDLQSADARILSPAEIPLFAQSQRQRRTMLLTLFLGAAIGVGIVFLLDYLNNTFRSPLQLEDMSGMAVLGTLPMIGTRMKRMAILEHLKDKPNSALAESVRNLRTSVLLSNVDSPPKVVMFTSSVPQEGKTTSAMLMALTSRQMGKSAIIVDCDLRIPALASMLKEKDDRPGLLSVIAGVALVEEAIYEEPTSGVHILTTRVHARRSSVNAADVLSSKRFAELIANLRKSYDLVIIDAPPVLVVTDARILSKLVDAIVYAVAWDKTPRGAVLEGLKELRSVNAPVVGHVMTLINEARATRYAYDGYNYYKGQYRDYYVL